MPLKICVFLSTKTTSPHVLLVPILLKWNIISPWNIFFQTHHHWLHLKLDGTLTESASIHKWMHSSSIITLWWDIFIFVICAFNSTGNKVLANSLGMAYLSRMFDSHIFTRCSPFLFFIPVKYLSVKFPSGLLAANSCIHKPIHVSYNLSVCRQSWLAFVFFNQGFYRNSVF